MTVTKVYYKHRGVVFRVHEATKNMRENYMRQRLHDIEERLKQENAG